MAEDRGAFPGKLRFHQRICRFLGRQLYTPGDVVFFNEVFPKKEGKLFFLIGNIRRQDRADH